VKEVTNNTLNRIVEESSIRNRSAYRDDGPAMEAGQLRLTGAGEVYRGVAISNASLPPTQATTRLRRRRKSSTYKGKGEWRVRWKQILSIPTSKSPLAKILSPVVMRAQREIVVKSRILTLATLSVLVDVPVAVPVPLPDGIRTLYVDEGAYYCVIPFSPVCLPSYTVMFDFFTRVPIVRVIYPLASYNVLLLV
jgi:hypothetical protein